MSWKLEHIYESQGNELANALHPASMSTPVEMAYDGRYLWVTAGLNGIFIYEFWGASSDHEPAWSALSEGDYTQYDSGAKKKLRLVTTLQLTAAQLLRTTIEESLAETGATTYAVSGGTAYAKVTARSGSALNARYIAKVGNRMYVTNGASFTEIYELNIQTHNFTANPVINVAETFNGSPRAMNSNLCSAGNKLWFVGGYSTLEVQDPARQKLYSYDPFTSTKQTIELTRRPALARSWIADGYNGSVYVTAPNDVGVTKVNIATSNQTYIRDSAFPTRVWSGQDRRIWVNSFGGMLTLIDHDDDQIHQDYSTEVAGALSASIDYTDGKYFWFVKPDGKLVRLNLNNKQYFETGSSEDWEFSHPRLTTPESILITTPQIYQKPDFTTVTVKSYMLALQDTKLIAFRLEKYLYRDAYFEMNGQGAVSSGPELYFGE